MKDDNKRNTVCPDDIKGRHFWESIGVIHDNPVVGGTSFDLPSFKTYQVFKCTQCRKCRMEKLEFLE